MKLPDSVIKKSEFSASSPDDVVATPDLPPIEHII